MKPERSFKGIWIPAEIWETEELEIIEKVVLIEIDSLDNEFGCVATNQYFANFFKRSPNRISQIISKLFDLGYLNIYYAKDSKRTITTTDKFKSLKSGLNIFKGDSENLKGGEINTKGDSENLMHDNNTCSNTFNNTCSVSEKNAPSQNLENHNKTKKTFQKVASKSFPKEILFEDCAYADYQEFSTLLISLNVLKSEHEPLYKKISLNAKSKALKKADWKAYIELWVQKDIDQGLAHLKASEELKNKQGDTSKFEDINSEIKRKVHNIYRDFLDNVFDTPELLESAYNGLRLLWKDANSSNRDLITNIVSKMQTNQTKKDEPKKQLTTDEPKIVKGLGTRLREKLKKEN